MHSENGFSVNLIESLAICFAFFVVYELTLNTMFGLVAAGGVFLVIAILSFREMYYGGGVNDDK